MPRATPYWSGFVAGEWSDLLAGRTDLVPYSSACALLENFLPLPQGPATRRPGTLQIARVKGDAQARLISFVFGQVGQSGVDAYVLEVTSAAMRVYRDREQIQAGGVPYTLATPYTGTEPNEIVFVQSEDVLFIAHANHPVMRLERRGNADWTLVPVEFRDGPYLPINTDETLTITPSALTGSITLTASSPIFFSGQVGGLFRLQTRDGPNPDDTVAWSWVEITSYTDSQTVGAEVIGADLLSLDPTANWREGAFSVYRGFPSVVTLHDSRLWLAATRSKPTSLWASRTNVFDDMSVSDPLVDDDALSFTFSGKRMNTIRWMASKRSLIVGTYGGEWSVSAGSGATITPTNINAREETAYGCNAVDPVEIGNTVFFAQRGGLVLIGLAYRFEDDALAGQDMTLLASHIAVRGGIVDLAYTAAPLSTIWAVRGDGALLSMAYNRDQKILAWARHFTNGLFESITAIPAPGGATDDLYCSVLRITADGGHRRSVEVLVLPPAIVAPQNDTPTEQNAFYEPEPLPPFLDSARVYSFDDARDFVTGLSHLEGDEVRVVADGVDCGAQVVVGGQAQLPAPARHVTVGLRYVSILRPMRPEGGAADGTSQNRVKTLSKLRIRVRQSIGGRISTGDAPFDTLIPRDASLSIDAAPVPYSGVVQYSVPGGYNTEAQPTIAMGDPYPMTIISITPTITTND